MDFLKVFIVLWTCIITNYNESATPVIKGSVNPWELQQTYCGELLERTIEIVCVESKRVRHPREILAAKAKVPRNKHKFFRNKCCIKQCSLNFIKSNCPRTRKGSQKKKHEDTIQQFKTSKAVIITPKERLELLARFGKQNNTNIQSPFTPPTTTSHPITTTTTPRPISTTTTPRSTTTTTTPSPITTTTTPHPRTTTTTRRLTTTTTTQRPSTTTEYYDNFFFILPSS